MHPCYSCGNTIAFGGIKDHGFHFCSKTCHAQKAQLLKAITAIPDESALTEALHIHNGPCARCKQHGNVDFHKSTFVWSIVLFTKVSERVFIGCKNCARKSQALTTAGTLLLGWWGIPFGILFTPIATLANVYQLMAKPIPHQPSEMLLKYARERLAILNIPELNREPAEIVETWTESKLK